MGARGVLPSLTTDRVSIRRESAVDVTEAKDDLRSGPPVPGSDRPADEMADVVCEAAAVDPVLISRTQWMQSYLWSGFVHLQLGWSISRSV